MVPSGSHSNGSNLQGLDDPLENSRQSSVSFNSNDQVHYYTDDDRTLEMDRISMATDDLEQEIQRDMQANYQFDCCIFRNCNFHTIRSAARILSSMTYEVQSGVNEDNFLLPDVCYNKQGVAIPRCVNAYKKAKIAYEKFWEFPVGVSPSYDFVSFALKALEEKPPEPAKVEEVKPSDQPRSVKRNKMVAQSGELIDNQIANQDKILPLTVFSDDTTDIEAQFLSARDDTFYVADTAETDPDKFFRRPINLATYSWQVGSQFAEVVLNPFALYWANKKVINRIAHHRLMKCDMCVKILINGTPFHYGMIMASVHHNEAVDILTSPLSANDAFNVGKSQRPHVFLDPTTSQGGCLRLPFINQRNAFDMCSVDTLLASTIHLSQLVQLRHVSGIVEPITITVMAWAENVVFSGPTMVPFTNMVPQSGDEYGDGIISRPAYILAKIAGSLSQVPHIGPYALASSIGAMRLGHVAKIFGFSKPVIVSNTMFMKSRDLPNMSSATAHDPIFKATFDDKAEVTVDPRVVGAEGSDEMTVASIVTRESYLTQFVMAQGALPGTRLFQVQVAPTLYALGALPPTTQYHMTPVCWMAQPFNLWKGTMRYRFRCVSSTFHRGRIRIVYDPKNLVSVVGSNTMPDHNIQHTYVWDLAMDKEAVVDVGWHGLQSFLEVPNITLQQAGSNLAPFIANPTAPQNLTFSEREVNGSLTLIVMNELTAPNVNLAADINILVSVSALEDMEFANPSTDLLNNFQYTPQSGEVIEDTKYMPVAIGAHVTFGKPCKDTRPAVIHHGDPVTSVRSILKRYMHSVTVGLAESAGIFNVEMPAFPLYGGKAPGAIHLSPGGAYNYANMTHLNWFTPAYLCRRGGIRIRAVPLSRHQMNQCISRKLNSLNGSSIAPETLTTNTGIAKAAVQQRLAAHNGWTGMQSVSEPGEPLDIEIPYHSHLRYSNARHLHHVITSVVPIGYSISARLQKDTPYAGIMGYDIFASAADDFSLAVFVNVPPLYRKIAFP